jgi:hypothetical protein
MQPLHALPTTCESRPRATWFGHPRRRWFQRSGGFGLKIPIHVYGAPLGRSDGVLVEAQPLVPPQSPAVLPKVYRAGGKVIIGNFGFLT